MSTQRLLPGNSGARRIMLVVSLSAARSSVNWRGTAASVRVPLTLRGVHKFGSRSPVVHSRIRVDIFSRCGLGWFRVTETRMHLGAVSDA